MPFWTDAFRGHLLDAYRQRYGAGPPEAGALLEYLLAHNLIPAVTRRRFVILREFERRYPQNGHHKTKTVLHVAEALGISESTVWTVLKDHSRDFDQNEPR